MSGSGREQASETLTPQQTCYRFLGVMILHHHESSVSSHDIIIAFVAVRMPNLTNGERAVGRGCDVEGRGSVRRRFGDDAGNR